MEPTSSLTIQQILVINGGAIFTFDSAVLTFNNIFINNSAGHSGYAGGGAIIAITVH